MARFVLVHGAWHGAWSWEGIAEDLRSAGHEVDAIDLPGHGEDATPHDEITLDSYVDRVAEAIGDDGEPVILVAHSMGGIPVTQALERLPERVAKAIYVTSFLPKDGESLQSLASLPENPDDKVIANCEIAPPDAILPDWAAKAAFYNRCTDEQAQAAISQLNPQPLPPLATPVQITAERAGSVERHYVACTADAAIPIALQRRMIDESPCASVVEIDTDHSPFISARAEMTEALLALA
jgi:alpha-beta hydrolase superfamily lysophospholipase